jgi:hypothetical protein
MKKIFYSILGLFLITSCEDNEMTSTVSSPLTAELSSVVRCNLDITNDTNQFGRFEVQPDFVPSGTKLHFTVSGRDLQVNPVAGYNYQDVVVTGSIGVNGEIKISVPVGSNGSNVTIGGNDFEANYTYIDFDRDNKPVKMVRKETFRLVPVTISLKPGLNLIQPLTYSKK